MNTSSGQLRAVFGPDTRFEVAPAPPAPFRARQENELERLKNRLLRERLDEAWEPERIRLLRRAANEAASLAWVSPYPLLVFPTLFEEKITAETDRLERQERVYQVSRELLAV